MSKPLSQTDASQISKRTNNTELLSNQKSEGQKSEEQKSEEDLDLAYITYIVRRSENPHPMTIIAVIIVVALVLCFLYKKFLKPSVAGVWICGKKERHIIDHDKYKDIISVDKQYYGMIKGNMIVYYVDNNMKMGVWIGNTIEWTDGDKWQCVCGY
jgi:hypothetical protein